MRNGKDVFESHLLYTLDWNIDSDIEYNYASDCIMLTSYGAFFGRIGIKRAFSLLESQIPGANFLYTTKSYYKDIAFLEWQAESDDSYIEDGADTYFFCNGKIKAQTMHYTLKARKK